MRKIIWFLFLVCWFTFLEGLSIILSIFVGVGYIVASTPYNRPLYSIVGTMSAILGILLFNYAHLRGRRQHYVH